MNMCKKIMPHVVGELNPAYLTKT